MLWLKKIKYLFPLRLQSYILCIFIFLSIPVYSQSHSVLKEGQWIKIPVQESGVYKLDYQTLQAMGWPLKTLNPRTIRIFGGAGSMLPQANRTEINNNLTELAIQVVGEEDGTFDREDGVYFYAEGTTSIMLDVQENRLRHQMNLYSEFNYYYLNIGSTVGKRINQNELQPDLSPDRLTTFEDYWFHEKEAVNLLRSGRAWWGEYLATTKGMSLQAKINHVVPNSNLLIHTSAIAAAQVSTSIRWFVNQQVIGTSTFGSVYPGTYNVKALETRRDFNFQVGANPSSEWNISIEYDRNGQSNAQSYLNYVSIQAKRLLQEYDLPQHYYFLPADQKRATYQQQVTHSDWQFWNVSDLHQVIAYPTDKGTVADTMGLTFRKFIGFRPNQATVPKSWIKIANQNVKAQPTPDLILISTPDFLEQAHRLARFKRQFEGIDVVVGSVEEIYNEFSSGKVDVAAIRNFVRYLYLQNPAKLKYVLLLGDATYDYKDLLKTQTAQQKRSYIPVYESRESLNPVQTYSSDDFYGFMDEHEGDWGESTEDNHTLELGVGRLPVKHVEEAKIVVDKIIQYTSSKSGLGKWRNRIHFVADDGDGEIHQDQVDEMARLVDSEMMSTRILLDAYPHTNSEYGEVVPKVNKAILDAIQQGTLILNYTGHGGTSGWAQEQVLTLAEMQTARGYKNMPLLLTATCDFGRYDDHAVVSGGELMVLSPKGAAIAALSTTRPVYSSSNFMVNKAFYDSFLTLGSHARIGDILRRTKNLSLVGNLNRNFSLLGDPSLRLQRGEQAIGWESIPDTLRAWDKVLLKGVVLDAANQVDDTFSGIAQIQLYDRANAVHTKGNKGDAKVYQEYQNKIFEGQARVTNGRFDVLINMPGIPTEKAIGKLVVYAVDTDSLTDAVGQKEVWMGGAVAESEDVLAPLVKGFINHPEFKSGDLVVGEPVLFLNLMDSSGIYISNDLNQTGIVLTINDTLVISLNDYYIADKDTYTRGSVRYDLPLVDAGRYKINVKVGDLYNNISEITFDLQLDSKKGIQFKKVQFYPNPFDEELFFEIVHNRPDEDIALTFTCFNKAGQKLFEFSKQYYNSELLIKEIIPPLYLKLLNFVENPYLYRIEMRSLQDQSLDIYGGKLLKSP